LDLAGRGSGQNYSRVDYSDQRLDCGYESIQRLLHPQEVAHLWAVVGASIIGFLGNEAVAIFRIRVGREISSVALIADGYHTRFDGWTSLAVLVGASGV
jgi:divalent metal cation (Fe/Co/Zn/Cd) transporter